MTKSICYPLVHIIILNWNGWQDSLECLTSLEKINYQNYRITIIDNDSENDSVEQIKTAFPHHQLLEIRSNLGFAGGNNIGLRQSINENADYILLLNNDTVVDPDFLTIMVKAGENDSLAGAFNPKIYFMDNSQSLSNKLWSTGGETNLWLATSGNRGKGQNDNGQYDRYEEVDFGTGCCLLIKCSALETVGLLNEEYFAYYEDVDWSFRLRRIGLQVKYVPEAKIWHKAGASSKSETNLEGQLSPYVHYLAARNHLWLIRSYAGIWQKVTAYPSYFVHRILFYSIGFILLKRWKKLTELWRGFRDGVLQSPM